MNAVRTADAKPLVVTVTGLAVAPDRLTMSEEGSPSEKVKVTVNVSTAARAVALPTSDGKPGQPANEALLTGTLDAGRERMRRPRDFDAHRVAVELAEFAVLSGCSHWRAPPQGIGIGSIPSLRQLELVDSVEQVCRDDA